MPYKPKDFPLFSSIPDSEMKQMIKKMSTYFKGLDTFIFVKDLQVTNEILTEIIERIEKRRVYFHIFYDGCEMGELNEVSLMCFWILKLAPFYSGTIPTSILNAKMALYLFINAMYAILRKSNKKLHPNPQLFSDLYYAFRFRDLSKEAIMALTSSLVHSTK